MSKMVQTQTLYLHIEVLQVQLHITRILFIKNLLGLYYNKLIYSISSTAYS